MRQIDNWSGKRDSNPRPSAWEADALPTELFPLVVGLGNAKVAIFLIYYLCRKAVGYADLILNIGLSDY